jgi:hypothetical protein
VKVKRFEDMSPHERHNHLYFLHGLVETDKVTVEEHQADHDEVIDSAHVHEGDEDAES